MAQLKFPNIILIIIFLLFISCSKDSKISIDKNITPKNYSWLYGKKIFLDPGHGGKGKKDTFRIGPNGITEESVNLKVALLLRDLLKATGAIVKMSRDKDIDISLESRINLADKFQPDLLISLHHNGSIRRFDGVNYPTVLIWGTKEFRPASFQIAKYLLNELEKVIGKKGSVISDYAIFTESGTRLLRKTKKLCPGILGEAGFFSDWKQSIRLKDKMYLFEEAKAYFNAISLFFKRGVPSGQIFTTNKIFSGADFFSYINSNYPKLYLKTFSNNSQKEINSASIKITLDGVPIKAKKISYNIYKINYGQKIYAGGHRIKFSLENLAGQRSMILSSSFLVPIKKGNYKNLVLRGTRLIKKNINTKRGLKMLLAAHSMAPTSPDADKVLFKIALGFKKIYNYRAYNFYMQKIYCFYPQSLVLKNKKNYFLRNPSYSFPIDYHGKKVKIIYQKKTFD